MSSPINILYFANKDNYCKQLHRYLQKNRIDCNLLVTKSIFDLSKEDAFIAKCQIILCELFHNRILLEDAAEAFNKIATQSFFIGFTKKINISIEQFGTSAALRLTDIIGIEIGWEKIWEKILYWKNFIENPAMSLKIKDIPISDLLEMAQTCKWTALITIQDWSFSLTSKNLRGCIYFNQGLPEMAWSTDNVEITAIHDFLSLTEGMVYVYHIPEGHFIRNLESSIQEILMNYYTADDEKNAPKS